MRISLLISLAFFSLLSINSHAGGRIHCTYTISENTNFPDTSSAFAQWTESKNLFIDGGFIRNQTLWCCIKIFDLQPNDFLVIDNNQIDSLSLISENRVLFTYGDKTNSTNIAYGIICIPITKEIAQKGFFLKVKKKNSFLKFGLSLRPSEEILKKSKNEGMLFFLQTGAYFLLSIGIIIILLVKRNLFYLLFICSLIFGWSYVAISLGVFQNDLFGSCLYYSEIRFLCVILWFFFLMSFLQHLLSVKKYFPRINSILNKIALALSIYFLILAFGFLNEVPSAIKLAMLSIYLTIVVTAFIFFYLCIQCIIQKNEKRKIAVFFILPHLIWVVLTILSESFSVTPYIHSLSFSWLNTYDAVFFGIVIFEDYYTSAKRNIQTAQALNKERKTLSRVSETAQLKERRNFANLLHDKFSSQLAHLGILAELNRIEDVKTELKKLAGEMRNFSHHILPKSIDDGALISVLNEHMNWLNNQHVGIKYSVKTYDVPENINPEIAMLVYLITLELIANAQKHGKASRVDSELFGYKESLSIHFYDNGSGFNMEKQIDGFGLTQIKNRIKALNGAIEVNSKLGAGTEIFIEIPINHQR
jgi:signal transduction histidine kinase